MSAPTSIRRRHVDKVEIGHVEFAQTLVANRRAAVDLTVDQIREMAAVILVLDNQIDEATRRMATMMVAEAAPPPAAAAAPVAKREPEIVHVPLVTGGSPELTKALDALVKARRWLEANRYTSEENRCRKKFEAAAIAVTDICTPKERK